jgi:hypothetical protein
MAFIRQRGKSWYAYWDQYDADGQRRGPGAARSR